MDIHDKTKEELVIELKELGKENKTLKTLKEKLDAEFIISNNELLFQSIEKKKRASELILANKELLFQNEEKKKRASELVIANIELLFESEEKEKRASELIIANIELLFESEEKEKRATELIIANKYAKMLEVKNEQLSDFCNIVSHNLRGPLVNISMLVDFIEQSQDEIERNEMLVKIKPVLNHLMDVFDELVESLQVKQDNEIRCDRIILKDAVDKVLRGFETQIQEYKAEIQLDVSHAPEIDFPQNYIESIFTNLISNALKYKSPNRTPIIIIKTKRDVNNTVLLSVADNGLGIDLVLHKNQLFKIRKTFHSHPDAKGFGLFMTKSQVEAMGGEIWAESQPEKGSTFYIEFKNQKI